jgi:hypothetical protein
MLNKFTSPRELSNHVAIPWDVERTLALPDVARALTDALNGFIVPPWLSLSISVTIPLPASESASNLNDELMGVGRAYAATGQRSEIRLSAVNLPKVLILEVFDVLTVEVEIRFIPLKN